MRTTVASAFFQNAGIVLIRSLFAAPENIPARPYLQRRFEKGFLPRIVPAKKGILSISRQSFIHYTPPLLKNKVLKSSRGDGMFSQITPPA
jgi:hypothetical protein